MTIILNHEQAEGLAKSLSSLPEGMNIVPQPLLASIRRMLDCAINERPVKTSEVRDAITSIDLVLATQAHIKNDGKVQ